MIKKPIIVFILILSVFFFLFCVAVVSYMFFFRPYQVNGRAMNPSFTDKEYVLTSLVAHNYSRGDVVMHSPPGGSAYNVFMKRIVGLPGETIMLKNGEIYINDVKLEESYVPATVKTYGGSFLRDENYYSIPPDAYFVLGDNRPYSSDSREYGPILKKDIVSKVMFCYYNCSTH